MVYSRTRKSFFSQKTYEQSKVNINMRIIWIGNLKDSLEIIQSIPEKEIKMLMKCRIMHVCICQSCSQDQNLYKPHRHGNVASMKSNSIKLSQNWINCHGICCRSKSQTGYQKSSSFIRQSENSSDQYSNWHKIHVRNSTQYHMVKDILI